MAYRLTMATIDTILTLHKARYSNREIARLTGVHRETVGKYIAQALTENRPAPTGSVADTCRDGSTAPLSKSDCREYHALITAKLEAGLSAKRIQQDLVAEHEAQVSYWSVRRYVVKLCGATPLPFRRLETPPGEEAQVDFGTGAWVITPEGKRRRPWIFRIVLSHSRKAYSEAVWRQTTDNFIACLENAFYHFGGAVERLVIDNLKAAVPQADWYDPEIHPKLRSFAAHYGTAILPTRPYTPRHKGKVESSVKYVKNNGLKGRTFTSLAEQNAFLDDWERLVADTRIHGTTKQQVGKLFERERPHFALCRVIVSRATAKRGGRSIATGMLKWTARFIACRPSMWAAASGRGGTRGWCGSTMSGSSHWPCMPKPSPAGSGPRASIFRGKRSRRWNVEPTRCCDKRPRSDPRPASGPRQ